MDARTPSNRARTRVSKPDALIVLGTDITLCEPLRQQAETDLGFDIEYKAFPVEKAELAAVQRPDSFHLYDHFFHSLELVWAAGSIGSIHLDRLTSWGTAVKKSNPSPSPSRPSPPLASQLFVQHDGTLGASSSGRVAMLPLIQTIDGFAYASTEATDEQPSPESWAWLFDDRWHGKVGLFGPPTLSFIELALAARSAGLMDFADIGQLSLRETDQLLDLVESYVASGHFKCLWDNPSAERLRFSARECLVGGAWPASAQMRRGAKVIRPTSPAEGYRAWQGGIAISSRIPQAMLSQAYAYLRWWLSGVPGAMISRLGLYFSVPELARKHLSEAEWKYWYLGMPADADIFGLDGHRVAKAGERRHGGSYDDRLSRVVVWDYTVSEHNYVVRRLERIMSRRKLAARPGSNQRRAETGSGNVL